MLLRFLKSQTGAEPPEMLLPTVQQQVPNVSLLPRWRELFPGATVSANSHAIGSKAGPARVSLKLGKTCADLGYHTFILSQPEGQHVFATGEAQRKGFWCRSQSLDQAVVMCMLQGRDRDMVSFLHEWLGALLAWHMSFISSQGVQQCFAET